MMDGIKCWLLNSERSSSFDMGENWSDIWNPRKWKHLNNHILYLHCLHTGKCCGFQTIFRLHHKQPKLFQIKLRKILIKNTSIPLFKTWTHNLNAGKHYFYHSIFRSFHLGISVSNLISIRILFHASFKVLYKGHAFTSYFNMWMSRISWIW